MAYDQAVAFRATAGYVTDGANTAYTILVAGNAESYNAGPRNGVSGFGWLTTIANVDARDRDNTLDVRLAGIEFLTAGSDLQRNFRLDVPATGAAVFHLASGDTAGASGGLITVFDGNAGGTVLLTLDQGAYGVTANHCMDATGTIYTDAAWPGSESGVAVNITQDHITVQLDNKYSAGGSPVALRYVRIASAAPAAFPPELLGGFPHQLMPILAM